MGLPIPFSCHNMPARGRGGPASEMGKACRSTNASPVPLQLLSGYVEALLPSRAKGDPMEYYATCPAGFEKLLAQELASLGIASARPLQGQAAFEGSLEDGYRACLWSQIASRIMLVLGRFAASTSDELYEGAKAIPWEDHIPADATIEIEAHGSNAALRNTQFVALRTKDAISDRLLAVKGVRPATDTSHPDIRIALRLGKSRASAGIDLAGEPLFRRGYAQIRSTRSPLPPLRPDYAAAMLESGAWFRAIRHDDPAASIIYSGGGTLAAEAARAALDRAPGLLRPRWGFTRWLGHDQKAWDALRAEADARAEDAATRTVSLICADARPGAETALRQILRAAGMPQIVPTFFDMRRMPSELASALKAHPGAPAFIDLSWLRQESLPEEAEALSFIAGAAQGLEPGTTAVALAQDDALDATFGCEPASSIPLIVGTDQATLRTYQPEEVPEHPHAEAGGLEIPVLLPASDQFAKRLQKVARLRAKWAKREDISCYRVYDADLPDYAVAIEIYQGSQTPGTWLQISEYAAPKEIDPSLARKRLIDVLTIAPRILGVSPTHTYLKVRTHGKGGSQYAEEATGQRYIRKSRHGQAPTLPEGAHLIDEGGLTFEVNFSNRLDCGIFLDHRETRGLVRELAKQTQGSKRFLNLFAYTGTATCYAADGGMYHTTTVDMSRPSLDWARRNMERNGFVGDDHEYVQADVLSWAQEQRHSPNRWDLIFCDVPTFSNSSRMRGGSWDVQRDHAELLITVSRLLTRNGVCVFSCNLRSFKPDVEALAKAGVEIEDITAKTIPEDFARNPKIHHCYLVRRTPRPDDHPSASQDARKPRQQGRGPARNGRPGQGAHHGQGPRPDAPRSPRSREGFRDERGGGHPGHRGDTHKGSPYRGQGTRGGRDRGQGTGHSSPYSAFY